MGRNSDDPRRRPRYANDLMVERLIKKESICCPTVINLMKKVDRGLFCPGIEPKFAYTDFALPIGYGTRLSSPSHHARALEVLMSFLPVGGRALDIGCGHGYMTACLSILAGYDGLVIGIDHVKPLVENAKSNIFQIEETAFMFQSRSLRFITADGRMGWLSDAPYHVIHVGAAYEQVPSMLLEQLEIGGRLLMPIGRQGEKQTLYHFDKLDDGSIITHAVKDVFVEPLCDLCQQCPVLAHTK